MSKKTKSFKRVDVPKSTRFEVFKRDKFCCQYCGASAPDAVLQIDHITPVSLGGDNEIINLITSCSTCNLGKGARELSDDVAIKKQMQTLTDLSERREQLEMLVSWRDELKGLSELEVEVVESAFKDATGFQFAGYHKKQIAKIIEKHSLTCVLDALDASVATYFDKNINSGDNQARAKKVFEMIPRVIFSIKNQGQSPWMKELYYVRVIVRNRMWCDENLAINLIKESYSKGLDLERLTRLAKTARNWTAWRNCMEAMIAELDKRG